MAQVSTTDALMRKPGPKPKTRPSDRDLKVISACCDGKRLTEIGILFGISRERVRQILAKWAPIARAKADERRASTTIKAQLQQKRFEKEKARKEQMRRVLRLRELGNTQASIAEIIGVGQAQISKILIRAGVMSKPGPRPGSKQAHPREPAQALAYLAIAEVGLNHDEIAENFQVSRQAVSRALAGLSERGYCVPISRRGAGSHRRNKEKSTLPC